ncbi:MAG: TatD family hydrolase [Methanoregula sp.]|jgi:TatD DNase family protein|nr:TatD family hydrolase [Methanoregula sp.]
MLIDTHCHLNFQAYKDDVDDVIRRALDNDMVVIIPGADIVTSKRAVAIAGKYKTGVYAAVGLHPVHLQDQEFVEEGQTVKMKSERFERENYARLLELDEVVAVGEVGIDYHYIPEDADKRKQNKQLQQLTFLQQLELAYDADKPVIVHCRDAHDDVLKSLKAFYRGKKKRQRGRGVLHCFSGDWDLAWQYFELGFLISFTGLITFNNTWDELLCKCPLDKFMVETDGPFMSPLPYRGKRNEPCYVNEVAQRIAEIKNVKFATVAAATTENARLLFGV